MKIQFPFGRSNSLNLDLPSESVLYAHTREGVENIPLAELPGTVARALAEPLGFPPLRDCLLDDDHLVIPVAPEVPQIETILRAVLDHVFSGPTEHQPARVTVLQTRTDEELGVIRSALESLPPGFQKRVELKTHHPEKKEEMAFLGVAETNETLVIHRELFDAEFVLPIGFFLPKGTPGHTGIHSAVYPTFSDGETRKRFRDFGPTLHATRHELHHELENEAAEATRQLGVLCMLQVVPGVPGPESSGVARVLAGDFHEVETDGFSLYQEIWTNLSNRRASVVLASVTGPEAASWRWVTLALDRASKVADPDGGAIVLCSELAGELPRAVEIYRQTQALEPAEKFIRREELPDAELMIAGLKTLSAYRVFFISGLDAELLEELGVMPLDGAADVERLIQNSGPVTILPDAQRMIF